MEGIPLGRTNYLAYDSQHHNTTGSAYVDCGHCLTSNYLACSFLISYLAEQAQELELDSLVYSWDSEPVLDVE